MACGAVHRQTPEAGARCVNRARRDLCGGYPVTGIPTATIYLQRRQDELQHHHPRQENHRRFPSGRALGSHGQAGV
ncbi:hypothetical protein CBM00_22075 [Klebsiella pneumoniae]|nr:hypothetical protein CES89_19600 [Klebsiella pneumoniae]ASS81676.1 hypothetical protein CHX41_22660 [Klebsiella pneumoniae]ATM65666.1 hypothetical protein CRN69_13730 [Klebsiella pneumoniae]AVU24695.1 hypothetical protein AA595_08815 [Klebsiella pneumoniae]AWR66139.1 hypothetical protein CLH68_25465 [Klebsiella pneumoniae]